jgi:hypothetical protein
MAGILSVDATFDRVSPQLYLLLVEGEGIPLGDANLLRNQVEPRNHLCDGMLHLNAGVHFHKVKIAVAIQQKLHGARPHIVNGLSGPHRCIPHFLAQVCRQGWARGFFQQLLVAALNGTIPFPQMHHIAVAIGQDLKLDMAGLLDKFL